jgi:hypothetical protein
VKKVSNWQTLGDVGSRPRRRIADEVSLWARGNTSNLLSSMERVAFAEGHAHMNRIKIGRCVGGVVLFVSNAEACDKWPTKVREQI